MSSKIERCRICGCQFRHTACEHQGRLTNCVVEPCAWLPDVCTWCVDHDKLGSVPQVRRRRGRPVGITTETSIPGAMHRVLREAGYPLHTLQLRDGLASRGYMVKTSHVSTALQRSPWFTKDSTGLWSLAEWDGKPPKQGPTEDEFEKARSRNQITKAARLILLQEGHPLHIHRICERFEQRGWDMTYRSLHGSLSKSPYFRRIGVGTYALVEWEDA